MYQPHKKTRPIPSDAVAPYNADHYMASLFTRLQCVDLFYSKASDMADDVKVTQTLGPLY